MFTPSSSSLMVTAAAAVAIADADGRRLGHLDRPVACHGGQQLDRRDRRPTASLPRADRVQGGVSATTHRAGVERRAVGNRTVIAAHQGAHAGAVDARRALGRPEGEAAGVLADTRIDRAVGPIRRRRRRSASARSKADVVLHGRHRRGRIGEQRQGDCERVPAAPARPSRADVDRGHRCATTSIDAVAAGGRHRLALRRPDARASALRTACGPTAASPAMAMRHAYSTDPSGWVDVVEGEDERRGPHRSRPPDRTRAAGSGTRCRSCRSPGSTVQSGRPSGRAAIGVSRSKSIRFCVPSTIAPIGAQRHVDRHVAAGQHPSRIRCRSTPRRRARSRQQPDRSRRHCQGHTSPARRHRPALGARLPFTSTTRTGICNTEMQPLRARIASTAADRQMTRSRGPYGSPAQSSPEGTRMIAYFHVEETVVRAPASQLLRPGARRAPLRRVVADALRRRSAPRAYCASAAASASSGGALRWVAEVARLDPYRRSSCTTSTATCSGRCGGSSIRSATQLACAT